MTNPTPHGQVPEALIDLIDAYAETRHRCGGIYNARTEAARKAVIEALSGVQALSAAPAVPTSVKGAMWFTKKPVTIQAIQWTGENLREVITFTDGPPDTRSHHAGMAWDACRDLVARDGLKIYTLEGKMLASPGDWIIRGVKGELYPCKPDIFQETYAAASPTPPAEQQAAPKAAPGGQTTVPAEWLEQAYREGWAACRDAETIGEEAEDWAFGNSTANSRMIDAQQAAPKQEVQEPHGWLYEWTHSSATGKPDSTYTAFTTDEAHARKHDNCRAIYTAPQPTPAELEQLRERISRMGLDVDRAMRGHVNEQSPLGTQRLAAIAALAKPAPAPLSDDVVKDAARYRWLREGNDAKHGAAWHVAVNLYGCEWDAAIDAARAAQGGKCPVRSEP